MDLDLLDLDLPDMLWGHAGLDCWRLFYRLPGLLAAVKARAKAWGTPYTRFIRETLERAIATPAPR
jgi:hypothetical protein